MKIVLAPDSFKGSLTSAQVVERVEAAAKRNFPDCEIVRLPIADGGEGTAEALVKATGGEFRSVQVRGSMGNPVAARYGVIHGDVAVIEMAQANGLTLTVPGKRDLLKAGSYGTGELIRKALEQGFDKLIIAVGGSDTNDGGIGAMAALGIEFLDKDGHTLEPVGGNLGRIADYRTDGLCPGLLEADITVMCDVDNPLLGPFGATYVYGPQKGGNRECLAALEAGMSNYADVVRRKTGISLHDMPGAGAAGGISGTLAALAGARLQSGISVVLEACGFEEILEDADLVVTGEGRLDSQSVRGKVLHGIGMACRRRQVPAVALVGGITSGGEAIYEAGIQSVMVIVDGVMELDEAVRRAGPLLEDAADRLFRMIRIGRNMGISR